MHCCLSSTSVFVRQLGFATMVAVAVKPMMCYRHPNGLSSLVEYPDTLCGGCQLHAFIGPSMLQLALVHLEAKASYQASFDWAVGGSALRC